MQKNISYFFQSFNSLAWVGVEQTEITFLNDFRWSEKLISLQDLLKFFKGDVVDIAASKTHFSKDIVMDKETAIFATTISRIWSYSSGRINELNTEMMEVCMKTFSFYNQFQQYEIKELAPCPKCVADLVFEK